MTEILPKYAQVISGRGETPTQVKAREEELRRLQWEREVQERKSEEKIKPRKEEAHRLAKEKQGELGELLKTTGITPFIREAAAHFGKLEDDEAEPHECKGLPKKVGARSSSLTFYVCSWNGDLEKSANPGVKYALSGVSLDYLRRQLTPLGARYQLSRYAVLLAEGEQTDNQPLVWHGEIPAVQFSRHSVRSDEFYKTLNDTIAEQNKVITGESLFKYEGDTLLPAILDNAELFNPAEAETYLQILDKELTQFAENYFLPASEQSNRGLRFLPGVRLKTTQGS